MKRSGKVCDVQANKFTRPKLRKAGEGNRFPPSLPLSVIKVKLFLLHSGTQELGVANIVAMVVAPSREIRLSRSNLFQ